MNPRRSVSGEAGEAVFELPLWCIRLPGDGLCVAQTTDGAFLILFTTRALAERFIREEDLRRTESATPAVYAGSRPQLHVRARVAAADGIRGMLINLQRDGQVLEVIGLTSLRGDLAARLPSRSASGRTLH